MMLRQYLVTAALFLFLVSNASNTFANDDSQAQAVRKTVASYCDIDIKEIKLLDPKRATAQVMYRRVAHSVGNTDGSWHLVADPMDNDLVTLNLIYDHKKWYVLDPPLPKISKQFLIDYYEATIKNLEVENDPLWQKERDTVKLLKSLP